MVVIIGNIRIPPANMADARPVMAALVAATRLEDGCARYSFAEEVAEPGLILIAEAWRDHEALAAHARSAHVAAWRMAGAELGVFDRNLMVYEAGDPRPL
jgi:quinol monooxygenase YgiN